MSAFRAAVAFTGGLALLGTAGSLYVNEQLGATTAQMKQQMSDPNRVYLNSFPVVECGHLSPWCLKAETYLRLAKIPYARVSSQNPNESSTGRLPYMSLGCEQVADSQAIIDFFSDKKGVDLNSGLSDEQHAIGRAIRRIAECDIFSNERAIIVDNSQHLVDAIGDQFGIPRNGVEWLVKAMRQTRIKALDTQGVGDLSHEHFHREYAADIKALGTFLKKSKFAVADHPTAYDADLYMILKFTERLGKFGIDCPASRELGTNEALKSYISRMDTLAYPDMAMVMESRREKIVSFDFPKAEATKPQTPAAVPVPTPAVKEVPKPTPVEPVVVAPKASAQVERVATPSPAAAAAPVAPVAEAPKEVPQFISARVEVPPIVGGDIAAKIRSGTR